MGAAAAQSLTWGTPGEVSGPGGSGLFQGVSCTDASDCTAVGYDNNRQPIYATETGGTWGTPTEVTGSDGGGGYFFGVSCTDATDCTAAGFDGILVENFGDAPFVPGNSGSPIFNQYGHVIAIHAAHLDDEDDVKLGGRETTVVNASPFRIGMRIDLLRGVKAP